MLPVPCRCADVVPKNVAAGVKGPLELVLARICTFTVRLVTVGAMRHSACTEPLMLAPVRPCVVASSTTEPDPPNVRSTRVKTLAGPPDDIAVCPEYWMVVAPLGLNQTTRSAPLGSEPPLLFILSPNGDPVAVLMPRYRFENG